MSEKVRWFVPVKHDNDSKIYLFEVPESNGVIFGERVIVETKHGKQYATCVSNAFCAEDVDTVCRLYGTSESKLRMVIGTVYENIWASEKTEETSASEHELHCFPENRNVTVVINEGLVAEVYADDSNVSVEVIDFDNKDDDSADIAYKKLMKDVAYGKMNNVF